MTFFFCLFHSISVETEVIEAVNQSCSVKKVFLEISQNSQENTCARVYFLIKLQGTTVILLKKETLAQVFSCEFYKISKNNLFIEHFWVTASLVLKQINLCSVSVSEMCLCFLWLFVLVI